MNKFTLEVGQVAGDVIDYGNAKPGEHYHLVTLSHNEVCIHDPRFDESGIHSVEPSYYGMSRAAVDKLIQLNRQLIDQQSDLFAFIERTIDNSVESIQKTLGVKTGDLASHHFSDEAPVFEAETKIGALLAHYALAEVKNIDLNSSIAPKIKSPGSPGMH